MGDKQDNELLFFNFNQDFTCIMVGTSRGFRIFKCDPFGECLSHSDGGIGIMEMLFSTSLLALVGAGEQPALSPRKLRLWNTKTRSVVCELNFLTCVVAVRMNRKRMAVVLERKVHMFELSPLQFLHSIDTGRNLKGVSTLSPHSDNCHLAVPGEKTGTVAVFDALRLHHIALLSAHNSPISCLAFDSTGTLLATASDKGTVVRVFSVPDMTRMYTLRRGTTPATIQSITFNSTSTLVSVTSDSTTVHIFKLGHGNDSNRRASTSSLSDFKPQSRGGGLLGDLGKGDRKFAHVRLKGDAQRTICACSAEDDGCVMIVTSQGVLYEYRMEVTLTHTPLPLFHLHPNTPTCPRTSQR